MEPNNKQSRGGDRICAFQERTRSVCIWGTLSYPILSQGYARVFLALYVHDVLMVRKQREVLEMLKRRLQELANQKGCLQYDFEASMPMGVYKKVDSTLYRS